MARLYDTPYYANQIRNVHRLITQITLSSFSELCKPAYSAFFFSVCDEVRIVICSVLIIHFLSLLDDAIIYRCWIKGTELGRLTRVAVI